MLSCLWDDAYKRTLAANQRVAHVAAAGFFSHYLEGRKEMFLFNNTLNTFSYGYMESDI